MANSIVLERHFVRNKSLAAVTGDVKRQRVYIFPTRYGFLFGTMIIVILIGGINYNNSMAYVLTFILSSVVMVGILYTYRNLAGLVFTAQRPEPVFCGQTAVFPVRIDNRNNIQRCSIQLERLPDRKKLLHAFRSTSGQIIDIPEDSLQSITVQRPVQQRGLIPYGCLRISTTFPLGLFRSWAYFEIDTSCIVYPAPEGHLPLPESVIQDHQEHAGHRPGADDFAGFRRYRPGDASNAIAWKQYARERDLLVTRFHGQGSRRLMLDLQQLEHLGSIERSLSQLCKWIISAEQQGMVYGLELGSFIQAPDCGPRHQQTCLEALARFNLRNGT